MAEFSGLFQWSGQCLVLCFLSFWVFLFKFLSMLPVLILITKYESRRYKLLACSELVSYKSYMATAFIFA